VRRTTASLGRLAALAIVLVAWPSGRPLAAPPSFDDDVIPVLTRFGCNAGACHGKLAGQNGFRLSLRGYAPEFDFDTIAREGRGRRISPAAPEHSLLVLKAIGAVPHAGGGRFAPDSPAATVLVEWIAAGMPGPEASPVEVVGLELTPATLRLAPDEAVPVRVVARYADGRQRDVTWLTKFASTDPSTLAVSEQGVVRSLRPGEATVHATFRGQAAIASFTTPHPRELDPAAFAVRHNPIDDHVFEKLAALRIEPSPPCDDLTFLRRAFIDAIGLTPTPTEVRAFLADPGPDKRQRLIDTLVERPEFVDHWTHWLADLLQNRRERDHDVRGTKGVRGFHAWLRTQVAARRGWDAIARDILTATGSAAETPAVGYFIVTVGEQEADRSEVGDSVAQSFLGTRIGCARCHNHPLERYTQDDYYHFAAYFSRVALDRHPPEERSTELVVGTKHLLALRRQADEQRTKLTALRADSASPAPAIEEAQKRLDDLERQSAEHLAQPPRSFQPRTGRPLDPRPLDRALDTGVGSDPREALVDWIVAADNPFFAGAMVNRLWKHFLGVGLVEPVDDLRATNPPSNQPLWDHLVGEFVGSGHDFRHLVRIIMNSRTYQLSSTTRSGNEHDSRWYSHFYPRRLPAETLLDAISAATGVPETFPGYPRGLRAMQVPDPFVDSPFLTLFGRSPRTTACACEQDTAVTLSQVLHLQNGDRIQEKIEAAEGRLARLLAAEPDDAAVAEEIFLATVSRPPTAAEVDALRAALATAPRGEVLADLVWALLNSKEFTFIR